jgi:hypothetical protein
MFVCIEYYSKRAPCLRNIKYKSTFEVVAVWLRLSSFLDMTFYFKPKSRFASQVIRNDGNRDMTHKKPIYLLGKVGN